MEKIVPARQVNRMVVGLCLFAAVFEGVDLQSAGVAAPRLVQSLSLPQGQLGWFFSASTFGLMLGAVIGGRLSDRFGRKISLLCAIATLGIFSLFTGFSNGIDELVVARFLTGVGLGGALPNLLALMAENTPPARRSAMIALLYGAMPTGGALVSLVSYLGSDPSSWRDIFFFGGIAPLAAIPALMKFLPRSSVAPRSGDEAGVGFARAVFGDGRTVTSLVMWAAFFFALVTMYVLLSWLPSLLVGRGLSRPDASLVQISFNLCGAVGSVLTGRLMDGGGRRWLVVVSAYILTVLSVALVASVPPMLAVCIAVGGALGASVSGTQTILYGLAPSVYPMRLRGTGVGVAVAFGRVGSAVGPFVAALLLGAGRSPSEVLIALLPVLAGAGAATIVLVLRRPNED